MIQIRNQGPDILWTNYWETEHAKRGFCYLSGNAGVWRLLVPAADAQILDEIRTGRQVDIVPSTEDPRNHVEIVFDDGSSAPFYIAIDKRQVDRSLSPDGKTRLAVWTEKGKQIEFDCYIKLGAGHD